MPGAVPPRRTPHGALHDRRALRWNVVSTGAVLLLFAALIWNRRWMSDDGLIVLRTVRNLLAGDGPVFNVGERVESNTSTLWTYLLALPGLIPGLSLNWASVVAGLLLSVAGLGFAMDAARRVFGGRRAMLPLGALVVLALPPFWDFGTSGLETGLIVGWLGLTWWLLVRRWESHRACGSGTPGAGRAWPAALVLGLAPLVRPDLALFGVVAGLALVVLEHRRGWGRIVGLAAVAAALPVAYEVFRAGYYGLIVPATALAKEASDARWQQGLDYLFDLLDTYLLWIPAVGLVLAALLLAGGALARRGEPGPARSPRGHTAVVVAVPLASALLLALYVIRVGGDFMHGRMLLPALFCLVMPVAVVPMSRWTALPVVGVLAWSVLCLVDLRPAYGATLGPNLIANERLYYVLLLGNAHPVTAEDYSTHPMVPEGIAELERADRPSLAIVGAKPGGAGWWVLPAERESIAWLNLGVTGELAPLDVRVLDGVGLVNPIAGHATGVPNGRIGHDKDLPPEWYLADSGVRGDTGFVDPSSVADARAALACPRTAEMIESYRAPLTTTRFWDNLTGSVERTSYRYPRDAADAATCAPLPAVVD
ncbi:MAG: glycosyltransferase family 39 protein [Pseudonocardia sp.]|nr:glycosyltransferase family 39 protein [Pseudonocardia sp.]